MKNISRFLAVCMLGIVTFNAIEAQEYIKINKDFTDKDIKFFKGEIYAVSGTEGNKKKFMAGDIECAAVSDVTIVSEAPQDKITEKDLFVQIKDDGKLHINVSSIEEHDTIWLAGLTDKKIVFASIREADIKSGNFGEKFRLIIPNTVTIWYNKTELAKYSEPQSAAVVEPAKEEDSGKTLIIILSVIIVVLILVIAAIFAYLFYKKRIRSQQKSPKTSVYSSKKSLTDFANDHDLELMELLNFNKDTIDQNYHNYKENEQKKVESDLDGSKLIVSYKSIKKQTNDSMFDDEDTDFINATTKKHSGNKIRRGDNFSMQLEQLQHNLIHEIRKAGRSANDSNELGNLKSEIATLKNENNRLKEAQTDFKNERSLFTGQRQEFYTQNKSLSARVAEFESRVIMVDSLKAYANSVCAYLTFCRQVSTEAYQVFNKIQTSETGLLLMNFQVSVNPVPIGNWMQIVQDIKETGATTNKNLIRSFSQIQNENEKLKEFQRQLFKEALVTYTSHLLILAEAFRNLSRFHVTSERTVDMQDTFGRYVSEIINKAKTVGIDIKYVPLFKNFEEYLGQTESTDRNRSIAYKEIKGLQKGDIAEIVSYGVKTIFEDSRTYIILA